MTRNVLRIAAFCLLAQAAPALSQGTPTAGSGDSGRMSGNNREENAAFNKLAAGLDKKKVGRTVAAKASDVVVGLAVADKAGQPLGSIESVDATSAIIRTGFGPVSVPRDVFGKNKVGLVLDVVKSDFDAQVMAANVAAPRG